MASSSHPTPRPTPSFVSHTHSGPSSTPLPPSLSLSSSSTSSSSSSSSLSSTSSPSASSAPSSAPSSVLAPRSSDLEVSESASVSVSVSMATGETTTTFEVREEEVEKEEVKKKEESRKKQKENEEEEVEEKEEEEAEDDDEEAQDDADEEKEKKAKRRHPYSGPVDDQPDATSPPAPTSVAPTPSTLALLRVGPRLVGKSADVRVPPIQTDAINALQKLEKLRWNWHVGTFRKHVFNARRALLGEFIGTALLVWFVCGAVISEVFQKPSSVTTASVYGVVVSCLVFALWNISGGQMNPAITLALASTGRISLISGVAFVFVQLLGCALGAGLLYLTFPETAASSVHYGSTSLGALRWELDGVIFTATVEAWQGLLVEIIATFTLTFVTFCVADIQGDNKHMGKFAPLAIGFSVFCGAAVTGPLAGGSLNPARSLAPSLVSGFWSDHWVYWVGPIIGGQIAGWVYTGLFVSKVDGLESAAGIVDSERKKYLENH